MRGRPFILNLGHGIVPETPPEHVAQLVERCLLYTSDAADDLHSVDPGGRRIIKKKTD